MTKNKLIGLALAAPALLWLAFAFVAPFGAVLLLAFQADTGPFAQMSLIPSGEQFRLMFADRFYVDVLWRTTLLAIVVAAISAALAYPVAFWLVRLPARWRPVGFALLLVPLLTNVVVRSLGIVLLLAPDGIINGITAAMGFPRFGTLLFNYGAVGLALLQAFLPFMVLALYDSIQATPPSVLEASESLGASPASKFFAVQFPLSLPGLASGMSILFLMASTSYVSATMLGGKKVWTTGMLVWQEALQNLNAPFASALALAMTLVGLGFAALVSISLRRLTPWIVFRPSQSLATPKLVVQIANAVLPFVRYVLLPLSLLFLLLPLLLVFVQSFNDVPQATVAGFRGFTLRWYREVLIGSAYVDSFLVSLRLAAATLVVALALALPLAFALVRYELPGREWWMAFLMLPLSLPHVAIGVGMLRMLQAYTALPPFMGLLAVHVVLVLPFTIMLLRASVLQLDTSLEDAAQSLGANGMRRLFFVILPGLAPGLCAAGIVSFLLSFEEVTVTSFLTTARLTTLPVRIYAEASFSLQPTVHAVSTLLILLTIAALALLSRIMRLERVFSR